jgi:hypothetical protein
MTDPTPPQIELRPVDRLIPSPRNARTHSREQVSQIADSLIEFGFTNPILVDDNGIVAGHGRQLGAVEAYARGATLRFPNGAPIASGDVPVIDCTGWTEEQRAAYMLADNRIALNAGWDETLLFEEMSALQSAGFSLELTGFDETSIRRLLAGGSGQTDPDDTPDEPEIPVTVRGDIWVLGDHRIMCGSSTDPDDMAAVLGDQVIDIAISDPPYGIEIVQGSQVGGNKPFGSGKVHGSTNTEIIRAGTYPEIIGDDSTDTGLAHYRLLVDAGVSVIVLWGGNYFASELPPSRCWLVWDKQNTGTFADAELAWTNQDTTVRLLSHQWSGLIKASERNERRCHPTQKPVALAEWVVKELAPEARVLFDGFLGSGWTLIAAERLAMTCVATELAPAYVDVAILRWQAFTGREAVLEATGQTFTATATHRMGAPAE